MRYTYCKDLDKNWSAITLGCWQLAPSSSWGDTCHPAAAETVVKTALDHGITAFDTAEVYGDGESERRLARALGKKREDVIIVSKLWPDCELTQKSLQERLDGSLQALQRDYIDVYLIHWPSELSNTVDKAKRLHDIMRSFQGTGKVRWIGLSNFRLPDLQLFEAGIADFSINQVPYSLLERDYNGATGEWCQQQALAYMVYSPTAKGLLVRSMTAADLEYPARQESPLFQQSTLTQAQQVFAQVQQVADELGCLPIEVTLAWVCQQPNVLTAIVGTRKPQQVLEFAKAGGRSLAIEHLERLTAASDAFLKARASRSQHTPLMVIGRKKDYQVKAKKRY